MKINLIYARAVIIWTLSVYLYMYYYYNILVHIMYSILCTQLPVAALVALATVSSVLKVTVNVVILGFPVRVTQTTARSPSTTGFVGIRPMVTATMHEIKIIL